MKLPLLVTAAVAATTLALAQKPADQDAPGSADHPLVQRYKDSKVLLHSVAEFDEFDLPLGPGKFEDGKWGLEKKQTLEGKHTRILYVAPAGRGALEVFRNYEQEVTAGGFEILYSGKGDELGGGDTFSKNLAPRDWRVANANPLDGNYRGQRYLAAKLARPAEGDVYVSLFVTTDTNWMDWLGTQEGQVLTQLSVIETKAMQTRMEQGKSVPAPPSPTPTPTPSPLPTPEPTTTPEAVPIPQTTATPTAPPSEPPPISPPPAAPPPETTPVRAAEMAKSISETGRIALYGIYFDTNQTTIKPASEAVLKEIANLLNEQPNLQLQIVGHTDDVGTAEFNRDLSERRANAVVQALVSRHQIASSRLLASGAGLTQPVASNKTEEGRAKNRRVELVAR
jgi:outer membrane protein OmpA-like peptidoglycan-associated protein